MAKFDVEVCRTLYRIDTVQADSEKEAERIVTQLAAEQYERRFESVARI
jgi:hypothetical protein